MATKGGNKPAAKAAAKPAAESNKPKRTVTKTDKISREALIEEAKGGNRRAAVALIVRSALSLAVDEKNNAAGVTVPYREGYKGKQVDHATRVRNEIGPETAATAKARSGFVWDAEGDKFEKLASLAKKAAGDIKAKDYSGNVKALLQYIVDERPKKERKAGKPRAPRLADQLDDLAAGL